MSAEYVTLRCVGGPLDGCTYSVDPTAETFTLVVPGSTAVTAPTGLRSQSPLMTAEPRIVQYRICHLRLPVVGETRSVSLLRPLEWTLTQALEHLLRAWGPSAEAPGRGRG